MKSQTSPPPQPTPAGQLTEFHRVLVAVGTDGGLPAIELALQLAAPDAVLMLARIHQPAHHGSMSAREDADLGGAASAVRLLKIARTALGRPCEIIAEPAPTVVEGLHRIAEREEADLLVLGPHRHLEGVNEALPAALRHSPCAVAVAGPQPAPAPLSLKRIGFAFTDTPEGTHAAAVAAQLAARYGAELHGFHVVPVAVNEWLGPAAAALHTLQRLDGTLASQATAAMSALGAGAKVHVTEGDPVPGLLQAARALDLLVVGARGAGPLRRLVTGSTSEALSTDCPCALLLTVPTDDPK